MSSYRVEVSPNNRAGCQDALCKKNGVKIKKGEIRFGVWVEGTSAGGHEFQSWRWRHWGCVSGKTLQNIRESLAGPLTDEDEYKWDNMDGLEEMPPNYQEKIKLAITEGKIADEDWKGDPAYNVLGKTGIRGRATIKKKVPEESEEDVENVASAETPIKPGAKKRPRPRDEEEVMEAKPIKKRATKTKKENKDADEAKPARNPRAKPAVKNEEDDKEDEPEPIKKPKARKGAKKEEEINDWESMKMKNDNEIDVDAKPARKPRAKKGAKKEGDTELAGVKKEEIDEAIMDVKPARKARGKKVPKEESIDESQVKMEGYENVKIGVQPAKKVRGKKVTKKNEVDDGSYMKEEETEDDAEDVKSAYKHNKHESQNGAKKGEDQDVKTDAEDTYKAQKPEDPLEQIASAFCDRDGPLVNDFNEMVEAQEVAGNDWEGFLQKKFRNMVNAGEIADNDFNGFLQEMHKREVAFREPVHVATKKGRKGKNAPKTAPKPRAGRGKVS